MADSVPAASGRSAKKRIVEYLVVLVVIGIVVAVAYYQEQLSAFFRLRMWDSSGPSHTVETFLTALSKGDKQTADSLLGREDTEDRTAYQPLMENGKWIGYFIVSQAGRMQFRADDIVPKGDVHASKTEYVTVGKGGALVSVPNAQGHPIQYRLEMKQAGWKITEMLGGRPMSPPPGPGGAAPRGGSPGGGRKPGGGAAVRPRGFAPPGSDPAPPAAAGAHGK